MLQDNMAFKHELEKSEWRCFIAKKKIVIIFLSTALGNCKPDDKEIQTKYNNIEIQTNTLNNKVKCAENQYTNQQTLSSTKDVPIV
ncbi:hypothetical protein LXL04_020893 [Taraxacum kok-saghyz]